MRKSKKDKLREKLEELVMDGSVDLSEYNQGAHHYDTHAFDDMIELLVSLPDNTLTFGEIIALTEDYDSKYYEHLSTAELRALNDLYPHWVDKEALTNRSDNYLSENLDESDWKTGYNRALSEYVIRNGMLVRVNEDHFAWEDYQHDGTVKYSKTQVIGAYNAKEIYWSEFAGTFVDADEKIGVEIDVLFKNSYSRKMRVEKGMAEIINAITA